MRDLQPPDEEKGCYCSRVNVPRGVFAQNAPKPPGQQARNGIKCSF